MTETAREPEERPFELRRIVVALDASLRSLAALEAAAELATRWHAELLGLFVEDVDLIRLAATPSAIRFLYPSGSEAPLSALFIENELKALAERARRELAAAAERVGVQWSFRVVRGHVPAEVVLAAAQADLLTLGGAGWSVAHRLGLGSTARAAIAGARSSLLLVQARVVPSPAVLTVYDWSTGAEETCRFAARLAAIAGNRLTVFLASPSRRVEPAMESEIARLIAPERIHVHLRWIPSADKELFLQALRLERGGVLVISNQSRWLDEQTIERILRETEHPLLIFGGRRPAVTIPERDVSEEL